MKRFLLSFVLAGMCAAQTVSQPNGGGGGGGSGTVTSATIAGTANQISVSGTCTITTTGTCTVGIPTSPALPGNPTTTTQSQNDNSTKVATTAYADRAAAAVVPGGSSRDVLCNVSGAFGPCDTGVVTSDTSGNVKFLTSITPNGSFLHTGGYRTLRADGTTPETLINLNSSNNIEIGPDQTSTFIAFGNGTFNAGAAMPIAACGCFWGISNDSAQDFTLISTDASNNVHFGNATRAGSSQEGDLVLDVQTGKTIHAAVNAVDVGTIDATGFHTPQGFSFSNLFVADTTTFGFGVGFGRTGSFFTGGIGASDMKLHINTNSGFEVASDMVYRFSSATSVGANIDGGISRLGVGALGVGNGNAGDVSGSWKSGTYLTGANCSNAASPAVCSTAAAGSVAIPTGVNPTLVVNTTAVTANSQIVLAADDSVTIAATTCNSTLATLVGGLAVTARTGGTSFTISYNGTITTNKLCVSFTIIN